MSDWVGQFEVGFWIEAEAEDDAIEQAKALAKRLLMSDDLVESIEFTGEVDQF